MGVSLAKGGNVSLSKEAPGLTAVTVGLGWDVRTTTGTDYDLDASALLCNESGKVVSDRHFVFYNNLTSPDGSVQHTGDNLTGEGEGDDESINVNLAGVPAEVSKIVFPVSIHDAQNRGQSFGQVRNAFIRVVNQAGHKAPAYGGGGAAPHHRGRPPFARGAWGRGGGAPGGGGRGPRRRMPELCARTSCPDRARLRDRTRPAECPARSRPRAPRPARSCRSRRRRRR